MISIFTLPKGFDNKHISLIQHNAIRSWMQLSPQPELILLGDDPGVDEVAKQYGLWHAPHIQRTPKGTPLVNSVFEQGESVANNDVVCYINCDIIVPTIFQEIIEIIANKKMDDDGTKLQYPKFLIVGRRWDLDVDYEIDYSNPAWYAELITGVGLRGKLHGPYGLDYFAYRKGLWPEIPPFAIGRLSWDNWLSAHALKSGAELVDATEVIMIIHQNHSKSHFTGPNPEVFENRRLLEIDGIMAGVQHASVTLKAG